MITFKQYFLLQESKKDLTLTVKLVDGHKVRQDILVDFIGGGHHYVYSCVPTNEIWIENIKPEIERKYLLSHELVEVMLMKHKHYTYETAHAEANKYEEKYREGEKIEELFKEFIKKDFSEDEEKYNFMIDTFNSFK